MDGSIVQVFMGEEWEAIMKALGCGIYLLAVIANTNIQCGIFNILFHETLQTTVEAI